MKEEQRRFEILLEHTDVPIVEEDLADWWAAPTARVARRESPDPASRR